MNSPWEQTDQNGMGQHQSSEMHYENGAMPQTQTMTASAPPPVHDEAAGNVDKIRDILFGTHMRDYDARFGRLEQMLMRESAELRDSTRKRMESLEAYVKKELDALHVRFKGERDERAGSLSALGAELRQVGEGLSKKIADVDDQASGSHHELREQFLQHGRDIADQIHEKHRELVGLLDQRFQELRKDKTDRSALASLFNEVALRLNDDGRSPGNGQ